MEPFYYCRGIGFAGRCYRRQQFKSIANACASTVAQWPSDRLRTTHRPYKDLGDPMTCDSATLVITNPSDAVIDIGLIVALTRPPSACGSNLGSSLASLHIITSCFSCHLCVHVFSKRCKLRRPPTIPQQLKQTQFRIWALP